MADFDSAGNGPGEPPINLAESFAASGKFKQLFATGMALVEESAAYLDGPGREEARSLSRSASLLYGTESMRLTTRLMQLASWLLLQRAANDGEMTRDQILDEKRKIRLDALTTPDYTANWEELPGDFVELVERSLDLQNRVVRLDANIYGKAAPKKTDANPVDQQIDLISTALGVKKV